ncbi:hypothetical protein Btru_075977 [Bulinus truncatus]|nr:hypothetical protein Btru_075977 [Bulinus truncatus]
MNNDFINCIFLFQIKLTSGPHNQASVKSRSRRSYLDNEIDTFPPLPFFPVPRNEQPQHYPHADAIKGDPEYEYPRTRSHPGVPHRDEGFSPIKLDQLRGLHIEMDHPDYEEEEEDLDGLDALLTEPLPKKINIHGPVTPETREQTDEILNDFIKYMKLKKSGTLYKCLALFESQVSGGNEEF